MVAPPGLRTGDQNLQREVLAQRLLHGIQKLDQETGAVFHGINAVFVVTVVGQGTPELCARAAAVGIVEGEHLEAQRLELLCTGNGCVDVLVHL